MDKVPIHLLNAFVVFNESKNINEAAAQLQITQPALSKQLKQLEDTLPSPVFTLSGRKKTLTPFGRDLHCRLKDRIGNIQSVVEQTWDLHSDSKNSTIRLAARREILDRISANIHFDGAIFFYEKSNDETIESLFNLESEIGIVHKLPDSHELVAKPLFKEEFQFVIPKTFLKNQPVFGETLVSDLKRIPCLGYKPADEILKAVCSFNNLEMCSLKMVRATENYFSIAKMVDAKLGWAILPTYLKVAENKNWIVSIPPKIFSARQFYIVYRPEFGSVSWFKTLISEVRSCFELS